MPQKNNINVIFPHQLFEFNPLFKQQGEFYLIEEYLFLRQYHFHKQKIVLHRAGMKFYENFLQESGHSVQYISSLEKESDIRFFIQKQAEKGVQSISITDPADDWLMKRIQSSCRKFNLELNILESPMFLNTTKDIQSYFTADKKKFFQTDFYKLQRIKFNILIDANGKPQGNQWTFDVENRKKHPSDKNPPKYHFPSPDQYSIEARQYVNTHFPNNPGTIGDDICYPIGFQASANWLDQFFRNRFQEFGIYEDAMVRGELLLNHSMLTPMLNTGMITPAQVIEKTIQYGSQHQIPINSLEGFIRQIIGWREFIRGVYISKGAVERTTNHWGFQRKIPSGFYTVNTGILPVDETIRKILKTGYCHHIERLMILGNFMLLCEFDPDEVYKWFMELFIDAYDWVMVPNIYGMSQFADGGLMSTKPYISGSNYLMKMSNFPKGEWQQTWDALFWRFLHNNRDFFKQNPRMGMLLKTFDNWDSAKREELLLRADNYLKSLDKN